jgi:hypothetical protein
MAFTRNDFKAALTNFAGTDSKLNTGATKAKEAAKKTATAIGGTMPVSKRKFEGAVSGILEAQVKHRREIDKNALMIEFLAAKAGIELPSEDVLNAFLDEQIAGKHQVEEEEVQPQPAPVQPEPVQEEQPVEEPVQEPIVEEPVQEVSVEEPVKPAAPKGRVKLGRQAPIEVEPA